MENREISAEETVSMSSKELTRLEVMEKLESRQITQGDAALMLGLSIRQIKRIKARYKVEGARGLISKKRGQPSNNRLSEEVKEQATDLIRKHYHDFGPTFANEKLEEVHGIKISVESLRKEMIAQKIWKPKPRNAHRIYQQRERRARLGELVQIDGSYHDWFEGRDVNQDECCLLVFIDDATSNLMVARFVEHETTIGYMDLSEEYFKMHGLPLAMYSDKHSIFRINTPEAKTGTGETQFERALRELDIELIHADTPQAKGRVEKANRTLQDRLIKEMRLRNICSMEEGNAFLKEFIDDYNNRFGKAPRCEANTHRPLTLDDKALAHILSYSHTRILSKNLECSFENVIYQIQVQGQGYGLRHARVNVRKGRNGQVYIFHKGKALEYKTFNKQNRPSKTKSRQEVNQHINNVVCINRHRGYKPKANHPWKQDAKIGAEKKKKHAATKKKIIQLFD